MRPSASRTAPSTSTSNPSVLPERAREAASPARACAVAEILAHHDPARAVVLVQPPREGVGVERGETRVETLDEGDLDALARKQRQPLGERGEARRGALRGEELPRQRLEGEHRARQPARGRLALHVLEDRRVAAVHAVEAADGDRGVGAARVVPQDASSAFTRGARSRAAESPCDQSEREIVGELPATITQRELDRARVAAISNHEDSLPMEYQSAPPMR